MDDNPTPKIYRTAFVLQNTGHDFQELLKVCERIQFVTNGYEPENELLDEVVAGLKTFEPSQDLIVPVGNVVLNLLVGTTLVGICKLQDWACFSIAVYYEKQYHFRVVSLAAIYPGIISGALSNGQE